MTRGPRFTLGIRRMIRARVLGVRTYYGLRSELLISVGNRIVHVLVRVAAFSPCTAVWSDQVPTKRRVTCRFIYEIVGVQGTSYGSKILPECVLVANGNGRKDNVSVFC